MRRLSPEEGKLFDSLKAKREELVALVEKIDVADDEDAQRDRRNAIHSIDEGVHGALRTLSRPRD